MLSHRIRRVSRGLCGLLLFLAGVYGTVVDAGAAPTVPPLSYSTLYEVDDIPSLEGFPGSEPIDLNEAGTVLCRAEQSAGPTRGYLWRSGAVLDLGTLGGASTRPLALEESETVVGSSQDAEGTYRPFAWSEGSMTALPLPEGFTSGEARDLLPDGTIGGTALAEGSARAVVWRAGVPELLPLHPNFACTRLEGLAGEFAVGTAFAAPGQEARGRAVLWRAGEILDLGVTPGYSFSAAQAVNEQGQVVVRSFEPPYWSGLSRWTAGVHLRLGSGGLYADAAFIDAAGVVCGSTNAGSPSRPGGEYGAAWVAGGAAYVLFEGRTLGYERVRFVRSMNSAGQILVDVDYAGAALLRKTEAKLKVTAEVVSAPQAVGATGSLHFTIQNQGPDRAYRTEVVVDLESGLVCTGVQASRGTTFVGFGENTVYLSLGEMPVGEVVTLDLTVRARAAGTLVIHARAGASNGTSQPESRAELSFSLPGEALAELRADADDPDAYVERTRGGTGYMLSADAFIFNDGTRRSRPTWVRFYLCAKPRRQKSDLLLRRVRLSAIEPGGYALTECYLRLLQPPTSRYVVMEIDQENVVKETDETNNVSVSDAVYTPGY